PDSIGDLETLKGLGLFRNALTSLPTSIGNLKKLEILDLSENQLTSIPDSIKDLQDLEELNLSGNISLTSLPNSLLELPSTCEINLTYTGLSQAILTRLQEACNAEGYEGPQIFYSMEERFQDGELRSLDELLDGLFAMAEKPAEAFPQLQAVEEFEKEALRGWLSRLSDTADHKSSPEAQNQLVHKVLSYLEKAETDPQFRKSFFAVIRDASRTCGDRVTLSLLHIGIAHQLATLDKSDIKNFSGFLLGTVWGIEILEEIARNKVKSLRFVDEIEVFLGYPIQLKERLSLDVDVQDMLYFACSAITPQDLNIAEQIIKDQQNDNEARCRFLCSRDDWKEALALVYPQEWKVIEAQNEADQDACTTIEDYTKAQEAIEKRWIALTAKILPKLM
ncbi:MAG: leucine-rich repeat domain-containing protein, partial [Chlamydiales bacterium]|nr:leucine-rich repeat domain-containing protein [Chlamydiales bacterium]